MPKLYEHRHPLLRERTAKLYTVEELAGKLNISVSSWSHYECGKNNIPEEVLTSFARLLQLNEIVLKESIDVWNNNRRIYIKKD